MISDDILWTQKAHSNSNSIGHFGYFLYEFISARFTVIAFIGLFNFAGYNYQFFGYSIATGIALFLYYIISDAFNVFWTGLNLKYNITKSGILFEWGVLKDHELFIPFDEISRVLVVTRKEGKRHALIFENEEKIKNGDYGFSKEIYFDQLSFENISDINSVVKIIADLNPSKVHEVQQYKYKPWTEKVPNSNLYLKFLQLLGFVCIYISTMIAVSIIDCNILPSTYVKDVVVKQTFYSYKDRVKKNILETQQGYEISLISNYGYENAEVEFWVSPLFKQTTDFDSFKSTSRESHMNAYMGLSLIFKLMALCSTLFSASYIFYKRGFVPFVDLSVLLILPMLMLIVAFYLFH